MKLFSDLNFFLHIESLSVYHPVSKTLYAKNSILYFLSTFFENRKQNKIKNRTKEKRNQKLSRLETDCRRRGPTDRNLNS